MSKFRLLFLFAAFTVGGTACDSEGDGTETGMDSGTDTATATDTDTSMAMDCAVNSGWPCSCNVQTCDDGSPCAAMSATATMGICSAECSDTVACPTTDYAAVGQCAVSTDGVTATNCALVCTTNEECPPDQTCQSVGGGSVCAP